MEIPVMIIPCRKENAALNKYRHITAARICPIFPKSIPPVPPIFATRPLNSSVVA